MINERNIKHWGYEWGAEDLETFGWWQNTESYSELKNINTGEGYLKYAVVVVTPEFMEQYEIPGFPLIRLYKANGEWLEYISF